MKQKFLECGKIVSVHGLRGEIKLLPWGNDADELCEFANFYLDKGKVELEVERARVHKNVVIVKFVGVDTVEQAQQMRGKVLFIDREQDSLEEGQYYISDLIGMDVIDVDSGIVYGSMTGFTETGANDVYHITCPDNSLKLIPAIPQVVIEISMEQNKMLIRPLKGLFDDGEEV